MAALVGNPVYAIDYLVAIDACNLTYSGEDPTRLTLVLRYFGMKLSGLFFSYSPVDQGSAFFPLKENACD